MKRVTNIVEMVRDGVRNYLENEIYLGAKKVHYEQQFGEAYVDVDYTPWKVTVSVSHPDTKHHSPLLERAILDVLPDWSEVEDIMNMETVVRRIA